MGANMTVSMHKMPDLKPGETNRDAYRRVLAATSAREKAAAATQEGLMLDWPDDLELPFEFDGAKLDDDEIEILAADPQAMEFIEKAFEEAIDGVESDYTTCWFIAGATVAITGGMSWGDSPTDAYDGNWLISGIDAFQVPMT